MSRIVTAEEVMRLRELPLGERKQAVKGCMRKSRYETDKEAWRYMRKAARQYRVGLRCYKCDRCGGWHLAKDEG